jgi:hypothetical protein
MGFQLLGRNRTDDTRCLQLPVSAHPSRIHKDHVCIDTRSDRIFEAKVADLRSGCSPVHLRVQRRPQPRLLGCPFPYRPVQKYPQPFATLHFPNLASQAANLHGFCYSYLVHQTLRILGARKQEGKQEDSERAGSLDMVQRPEHHRHIWIEVISGGRHSCRSTRNNHNNMIDRSRGNERSTIRWREPRARPQ